MLWLGTEQNAITFNIFAQIHLSYFLTLGSMSSPISNTAVLKSETLSSGACISPLTTETEQSDAHLF